MKGFLQAMIRVGPKEEQQEAPKPEEEHHRGESGCRAGHGFRVEPTDWTQIIDPNQLSDQPQESTRRLCLKSIKITITRPCFVDRDVHSGLEVHSEYLQGRFPGPGTGNEIMERPWYK